MFGSLGDALSAVKDRAIEACAKAWVNREIEKFGSVTDLRLDSRQRTLAAQLALNGETSTIDVHAGSYDLIRENGMTFISFRDFRSSREWIGNVLNQYVAGRKFRLPDALRSAL